MQQTIDLEQLYEGGTEGGGGNAVALIMRRWHWDHEGDFAGEDEMAWVFELRDHRIRSWRPYEDRAEALRVGRVHATGSLCPYGRCRAERARSAANRRSPRAAVPALGLP